MHARQALCQLSYVHTPKHREFFFFDNLFILDFIGRLKKLGYKTTTYIWTYIWGKEMMFLTIPSGIAYEFLTLELQLDHTTVQQGVF